MPHKNHLLSIITNRYSINIFYSAFFILFINGCVVSYAPDVRGWQCSEDADCTNDLECVKEHCRALCTDVKDCQAALKERCSKISQDDAQKYCLPPCLPGNKRACYTGSPKTKGIGICRSGEQSCTDKNEWGPCVGQILPRTEQCVGNADENCNGIVNENCTCNPGKTQACYTGSLKTKGVGACKNGRQICEKTGKWGDCKGEVTPKDEQCNGIDDNCNGKIDENLKEINKPCTVTGKKGFCAEGISKCDNGKLICNQTKRPTRETCDNRDDDCDGRIDNNPNLGDYSVTRTCYSASKGCTWDSANNKYKCIFPCRIGANKCLARQGSWSSTCENEITPKKETCNGIDDDCNGIVDDNIAEVGESCTTNQKGECHNGKKSCKNGQLFCQTPLASNEVCDKKDNDCNGKIDDGGHLCPTGKICKNGRCL